MVMNRVLISRRPLIKHSQVTEQLALPHCRHPVILPGNIRHLPCNFTSYHEHGTLKGPPHFSMSRLAIHPTFRHGSSAVFGFDYPPLPAGVDCIRVLKVEPGRFSESLSCTLDSVTFGDKPTYFALSYTWNDPYTDSKRLPISSGSSGTVKSKAIASPLRDEELGETKATVDNSVRQEPLPCAQSKGNDAAIITLNGQPFKIGHNMYLALLYLRSSTLSLSIWIDAVCINQNDEKERNSQIALMSFIYKRAAKVIAWLGTKACIKPETSFNRMSLEWSHGQTQHLAASLLLGDELRRSIEPDLETFIRIAESSYWKRLWIVQEMCIPRSLIIALGADLWTYEEFADWVLLLLSRRLGSDRASVSLLNQKFTPMDRLLQTRRARHTEIMRLESLIDIFASSERTEPRDGVYGLLGLANDIRPIVSRDSEPRDFEEFINSLDMQQQTLPESERGIGSFTVDYSYSLYDIWAKVIMFAFYRAKRIERGFGSIHKTELPIKANKEGLALALLDQHERLISIVRTAGLAQQALSHDNSEQFTAHLSVSLVCHSTYGRLQLMRKQLKPVVRAMGYLSSEIVNIGPDYESLVGSFKDQQNWTDSWEKYYHTPRELTILRIMDEDYMDKIITYGQNDFNIIQDIRNPSVIAWRMSDRRPHPPKFEHASEQDGITSDVPTRATQPRICLGSDHTIALVPPSAEVSDVIVRFWNCDTAIIVRPIKSNFPGEPGVYGYDPPTSFTLVGRADVAAAHDEDSSSERDTRAEQRMLFVPDPSVYKFEASGGVYVDLDLHTLQLITAATFTKTK